MRGVIFDVQRCSLQDGPGVRTTVFLKGCPLRCAWCHNPESWAAEPELSVQASACVACGRCVSACPSRAHSWIDNRHIVNRALCSACGVCVRACPAGALTVIGTRVTVQDVLREVDADKIYYRASGGGVTVSGGEPMAQPEFTLALLTACRERGIHTCLETCGFAPWAWMSRVAPWVDLFLYDYKATSPEDHKRYTGVSNELILQNLIMLLDGGARVILRCPLVEGVNDSAEHLRAIAALAAAHPGVEGVEVMAYHNLGGDKGERVGRGRESMLKRDMTSESAKTNWIETLHSLGCRSARIG